MDGEQETNATPTSFFRGISDKLDSQQRQQGLRTSPRHSISPNHHTASTMGTQGYRGSSSSAAAPYASSTRGSNNNSNNNNSNSSVGGAAVAPTTLITQVSQHQQQQQQQQQQTMGSTGARGRGRGGSYGDANTEQSHPNNSNPNVGAGGRSGNSHGSVRQGSAGPGAAGGNGGGATPGSRQRVHATELVERARYIRNQPKNTSPIDASAHPSLLPEPLPMMRHKKCLILDVDETLVHSSYQSNARYDVHLPIQLDRDTQVNVYVAFRPHLRHFLETVAPLFEIVVFTASLSTYCDPLMNSIDAGRILGGLRLFREHCSVVGTTYVKDLSLIGRNLDQVAIIDNSPIAYLFQQRNAIPITSWFDDPNDEELLRLIPVLEALAEADTVYDVLDNYNALLQLQQFQESNGEG